jgi:hypothetical protein
MIQKIVVTNGWIVAPHCWPTYLLRPVRVDETWGWTCVSVLGVAVFFVKARPSAPKGGETWD